MLAVFGGSACRTGEVRHISDPAPAIARLQAGGSIEAEVDGLVKPLLASGEEYGLVVGVVTPDGVTRAFRYGRTGWPGDPAPPDTNSLFQIGSVSKLFVTALLEKLVEEGQMSYADTVRGILPANIPVSEEVGQVTLYELATHTSGLPREPFTLSQLSSFIAYLFTGRNLYAHMDKAYVYGYLRHCHPVPKAERTFIYSNLGIGLLAHLIEVKTGRPVTELIIENICHPLDMQDSVFTLDAEQQKRLTVGHTGNQACFWPANSRMPPWDMGEILRASASMYATPHDLLLFAKANLGMAHLPLEAILATTHVVRVESARGGEALGWIIQRFDDGQISLTFKDGVSGGYSGYIGLDLDRKIAVVVLRNRFSWDDKIGQNLLLRLSGFFTPGLQK